MIYLIPVQLTLFLSFPIAIQATLGIQPSISDSWYALGKKGPLFTIWLVMVGLSIIGTFVATENPFYFASGACLCFCGVAAAFKERITRTVHGVGAIGGIACSIAGLVADKIIFPFWTLVVLLAIIHGFEWSNRTWWVEIAGGLCIIAGFVELAARMG